MTRTAFFFAIALLSSTAAAHDHWLVPSVAAPDAPMQFDLRMEVGERLVPEEERPFEHEVLSRGRVVRRRVTKRRRREPDGELRDTLVW